jgi:hypothetical protein
MRGVLYYTVTVGQTQVICCDIQNVYARDLHYSLCKDLVDVIQGNSGLLYPCLNLIQNIQPLKSQRNREGCNRMIYISS